MSSLEDVMAELQSFRQETNTRFSRNDEQLNKIVSDINDLGIGQSKLSDEVHTITGRLDAIENSIRKHDSDIAVDKHEIDSLKHRMKILESLVTHQKEQIKSLQNSHAEATARNMRNNVVLYHVPEIAEFETYEQSLEAAQKFFEDEMKIPHEKAIAYDIDRAHRIPGGKNPGDSARPLVLHFLRSYEKAEVMKHKDNVDHNKYAVTDQFPPEWSEQRLSLKIAMGQMPEVPKKEKKLKQNKLFVKGKEFTPNVMSASTAPKQYDATKVKWEETPKIHWSKTVSEKGNVFQACGAKINNLEQAQLILDVARAMCVKDPTHMSYGYILDANGQNNHHFDDDGEWGAGRKIYKNILDTPGCNNRIVVICRWFSGVHIGKKRWEIHEKLVKDTLKELR